MSTEIADISFFADEIMKAEKAGDIFERNVDSVKHTYKELSKRFHPDNASGSFAMTDSVDSDKVFQKLNSLYEEALLLLDNGLWEKTGYIELKKENGRRLLINYDFDYGFELGHVYVTKSKVIYVIAGNREKYYKNYLERVKLIYPSSKMEENFRFTFPKVFDHFKTFDEKFVIVIEKKPGSYPMKHVLEIFGGRLDARHVAWIISRLSDIACLFEYNGVVSNGLDLSSLFVDPKEHGILAYGAFFYMTGINEKMLGTTKEILDVMPLRVRSEKIAQIETDLESIKLIGRRLCGEANIVLFRELKDVPSKMKSFLMEGSKSSAYAEFDKWDKTLERAFGKRKFVEMKID